MPTCHADPAEHAGGSSSWTLTLAPIISRRVIKTQRSNGSAPLWRTCASPSTQIFTWADTRRCERLPELEDLSTYGWHATHTVRALAHSQLTMTDLGVWSLHGQSCPERNFWLSDGNYRARVLHAITDTQVPPPEYNTARRAYYRNRPLPLAGQVPLIGTS